MTTFAELQALTIELTRRPELAGMTASAIRAATLRAHCTDFFHRDAHFAYLNCTPTAGQAYVDVTDVYADIPRLRAIKFVQCVDATSNSPTEQLEYRDLDDVYDANGRLRTGSYTLAGTRLRIYPLYQPQRIAVACYLLPDVASTSYNSWIANSFPEEVATWAAAIVLHRSGNAEIAAGMMERQIAPFRALLIQTYQIPTVN